MGRRKNGIWKFEKEYLQKIINESSSRLEICKKLGLEFTRSQVKMIYYRAKVDGIDTSIYMAKNKVSTRMELSLETVLVENSTYITTSSLKKKLLKNGLIKNECSICGITDWLGKYLSLQLDHENGVSNDNRIENLRLLCPNCHSQTDTYSNKKPKIFKEPTLLILCCKCGEESHGKVFCEKCQNDISVSLRKVAERPDKNTLINDVDKIGYSATGRKYGVSDNCIRKWIKIYEKQEYASVA